MTPLARLTAILARTPGVPDSTPLTMGGEVELEVTIGDLLVLSATLAEALASANHQRKQKQASNISRNRAVQGIEHWQARAQAVEANLARAREIMKPFAAIIAPDGYTKNDLILPDDRDNWTAGAQVWGDYVTVAMVRAASRFLTEGEGR